MFYEQQVQISPNRLYMLFVAVTWSSSDGTAIHYVLPVLWMTSCFHIMEVIGRIKNGAYVSSNLPSGGTRGEVYHLRLHLASCLQLI